MALSAAAMVTLIDEAIASLLQPSEGAAIKRTGDSGGVSLENYSLDELRSLRREYATLAATAANSGSSFQMSKVTNVATSA